MPMPRAATVARGKLASVERNPQFDWSGFTFVDHRDIPAGGRNAVAMIEEDQPFLAVDQIRHQAEPIALLAHADKARLYEGLKNVQVHHEIQPAQLDFENATEVLKELTVARGDLEAGFARAEIV